MGRTFLDITLVILLLLLIAFGQLPKLLHEVLGVFFLVCVLLHIYLNRKYFTALNKGKWNVFRIVQAIINFSMLLSFLTVMITGICLSNHLFKSVIPLEFARNVWVHTHHVSLPFLMIMLCGIHLGFHGKIFINKLLTIKNNRLPLLTISFVTVALGVYVSFLNRVGDRLLQKHIFATPAVDLSLPIFLFLHFCLFISYGILGFIISDFLQKFRSK